MIILNLFCAYVLGILSVFVFAIYGKMLSEGKAFAEVWEEITKP